ncbi:hypothetical protein ACFTQ7_03860 [Lysinibacillus sp. NPDC056959]|uniref:hypothetical protein n=1 Tax=Lysinibacillus sp. NPDC056959 TaxID=3345981 RepID=UPI0036322F34
MERDPSGQVIKEWQNDHWIASSYDELGNRSQIISSLGAKVDVARNDTGNVSQITASPQSKKNGQQRCNTMNLVKRLRESYQEMSSANGSMIRRIDRHTTE